MTALARMHDTSRERPQRSLRTVRQFEAFFRSEYRGVLSILIGLVGRHSVAEELTQEAFLRAHRNWPKLSAHPNPEAWIRRVAINLSNSWMRRRGAEARALLRLSGPHRDAIVLPESAADWWEGIRRLPARQAQCVLLFYVEDRSVDDIAEILGLASGTVKAHLFHGRKALALHLGLHEEGYE